MFSMSNADELRQRAIQSQKEAAGGGEGLASSSASSPKKSAVFPAAETPAPVVEEEQRAEPEKENEIELVATPPAATDAAEEDGHEYGSSSMTTEMVEEFFQATIARLTSPEERKEIMSQVTVDVRIPVLLINIQHDQLEKMGLSKEDGQLGLNRYARTTATSNDVAHKNMEDFTHTCQRAFIEVLRDMQPAEEETEAKLTPAQIMEFFEACDTLLALPETKEALRKEFLETEVPPDETIVGMQRAMLRTLGFSPDHGVACLNTFTQDFPDEQKLQLRLHQFMQCATMARQEAVLGKEEMTKRMQMQQAAAMKERKMATELQALDEEGKKELSKRVSEMQHKHALAVMTLTTQDERLAYVKGIPADEQWEIAKLKMMTMSMRGGEDAGHGHSHSHGQPCSGHDHGHGHGAMPLAPPASQEGHSHDHQHGEDCSHDHNHDHSA